MKTHINIGEMLIRGGELLFKSLFLKDSSTFIATVFTNRSGEKTSLIAPACLSLVTSSHTVSTCSLNGRRGGCFLGEINGLTFK